MTLHRTGSSNTLQVHQAVLSDLDNLALLSNEFREFQGKARDFAGPLPRRSHRSPQGKVLQ